MFRHVRADWAGTVTPTHAMRRRKNPEQTYPCYILDAPAIANFIFGRALGRYIDNFPRVG